MNLISAWCNWAHQMVTSEVQRTKTLLSSVSEKLPFISLTIDEKTLPTIPNWKTEHFFFFLFPFYLSHALIHCNFHAIQAPWWLKRPTGISKEKFGLQMARFSIWMCRLRVLQAVLLTSKGKFGSNGCDFTGSLRCCGMTLADTPVLSQPARVWFCDGLLCLMGCRTYKPSLWWMKPVLLKSTKNLLRANCKLERPFALWAQCKGTLPCYVRHLLQGATIFYY